MIPSSFVAGTPRTLLRLEGLAVLALSIAIYAHVHGSPGTFAAWFLVPDLAMLAYLAGPRAGAAAYNTSHTYLVPALMAAVALATGGTRLFHVAFVWAAHIGFDRMLGYGLKYPHAFGATHLGDVGRKAFVLTSATHGTHERTHRVEQRQTRPLS